jgi:methionyl aminopeptidase
MDTEKLAKLRQLSQILVKIIDCAGKAVLERVKPFEIDKYIGELCEQHKVRSVILGYEGFPNYSCISINKICCHGIVTPETPAFALGDVVKIDLAIEQDGLISDSCRTFFIEGKPFYTRMYSFNRNLVGDCIKYLDNLLKTRDYVTPLDISTYISKRVIESAIYSCVEAYGGHGVGDTLHVCPYIPYNPKLVLEKDFKLTQDSLFTIEPIITRKKKNTPRVARDGWSVFLTANSTQYEETVLINNGRVECLTYLKTN